MTAVALNAITMATPTLTVSYVIRKRTSLSWRSAIRVSARRRLSSKAALPELPRRRAVLLMWGVSKLTLGIAMREIVTGRSRGVDGRSTRHCVGDPPAGIAKSWNPRVRYG